MNATDVLIKYSAPTLSIYNPDLEQNKPNFFIVGAAKCGTTSLWQYLRQHPDIFMPPDFGWKEPSYYCDTCGVADYDFYLSLFKDAGTKKKIGEASTVYLSAPECAWRLHKACPDAKIIIILRNPVDRAYSLYKWMRDRGHESIDTFEAALEANSTLCSDKKARIREKKIYYGDYLYFHSGLYCEQVRRYYSLFPANHIKVIIFEEFVAQTLDITQEIYGFLDVDSDFMPEIKIHNQSSQGYEDLSKTQRDDLERKYLPDVTRLSEFLNKDLKSIWFGLTASSFDKLNLTGAGV